jgi:lycopene cyclase domain-containing protein
MKKLSYLLFNLTIIFLPILSKLIYEKTIFPQIKPFVLSVSTVALIFIIWDIKVAEKWWFFNARYILGIKIFKLPIEEILFFFTVPFSCLVIFLNLNYFIASKINFNFYYLLIIIFLLFSFYFIKKKKAYPFFVFLFLSINIFFDYFLKVYLLNQISFFIYLIFTTFLTFIFNYYLTSKKIITYDKSYKTNFLITTIPFEDFVYGINLLYANLILYLFFQRIF